MPAQLLTSYLCTIWITLDYIANCTVFTKIILFVHSRLLVTVFHTIMIMHFSLLWSFCTIAIASMLDLKLCFVWGLNHSLCLCHVSVLTGPALILVLPLWAPCMSLYLQSARNELLWHRCGVNLGARRPSSGQKVKVSGWVRRRSWA